MPVDKQHWLGQLHASNFHNAFCQYRDIAKCIGATGRILIVGPGQGLDLTVFKSRGYSVTTYDIDAEFRPDHLGSVHDMSRFSDGQFDAVIASHVLEHMSYALFDAALSELARVARCALVYLPYAGRHIDLSFTGAREHHLRLNVPPFWRVPSLQTPRFSGGQHFWEIGVWGCSRRKIERDISKHFEIVSAYQNPFWLVSMNYVLESRAAASRHVRGGEAP